MGVCVYGCVETWEEKLRIGQLGIFFCYKYVYVPAWMCAVKLLAIFRFSTSLFDNRKNVHLTIDQFMFYAMSGHCIVYPDNYVGKAFELSQIKNATTISLTTTFHK